MVAFVPEKDDLNLKTLDFLLSGQYLGGSISLKVFRATVKERREELDKELTTIKRDREWLKDRISMLVECIGIPGIQLLMDEIERHESEVDDLDGIRWKRRGKRPWKDVVLEHIQSYNGSLKKIDEQIKRINEQLRLISGLPQETVVARWEQSNGESMLSKLVTFLKEDSRVVVLEETHT
jgi:chaperonin cofactor prefoldin